MAYTDADLDLVNRHVAEGARCVAQLEQSIAHAKALGLPTDLVESALARMRVTMALLIDHQKLIATSLGLSKTPYSKLRHYHLFGSADRFASMPDEKRLDPI